MDTMVATKTLGALCGALLIFLLGKWAAEELYHVGGHGYGDDHHQAYTIDTGAEDDGAAEEVVEADPPIADLLAAADVGSGENIFKRRCGSCHKMEQGANGTGPYLTNVVGRAVASAEGYNYSGALAAVVEVWTPEELSAFLKNPKGYAPGTKMAYNGLAKIGDRADLIAYLEQSGS